MLCIDHIHDTGVLSGSERARLGSFLWAGSGAVGENGAGNAGRAALAREESLPLAGL